MSALGAGEPTLPPPGVPPLQAATSEKTASRRESARRIGGQHSGSAGTLRRIESLTFQLINFGYHLGLALIVGGGLVLGTAAAPALFRALPSRGRAGAAFGEILARFDGLAILALVLVGLTAFLRAVNFETPDASHWARWAALLIMGAATLHASAWSSPVARQLRRQTPAFDDLPEDALARREFASLHQASRRSTTIAVLAGLVALFLS